MDSYERVHEYLSKLGMTTMESIIDTYLETSRDKPSWTYWIIFYLRS